MISEKAVNHAKRVSIQLNGYVLDLCEVLKRKKSHKKIDLEIQHLAKIIAVGSKAVRLLLQDDEPTIKMFDSMEEPPFCYMDMDRKGAEE